MEDYVTFMSFYLCPKWRGRKPRIVAQVALYVVAKTITHLDRLAYRVVPNFNFGRTIDNFRISGMYFSACVYQFEATYFLIFRNHAFLSVLKRNLHDTVFQ